MRHFLDQHSSGNSLHQSLLPYRWLPSLITLPAWDLHAFEFPPSVPKGLEHGLDALDDLTFVCFPIRSSIPSLPACWPRQSLPPQAVTTVCISVSAFGKYILSTYYAQGAGWELEIKGEEDLVY